ncbi:MAG: transglutaminase domain-containing protein, partial [Collinsella sp.]
YLLCAIACTSMVSATLPMSAIAEAVQPRATAEQQTQADATSSGTGKAEDGTKANATADTAEGSTATSTGTSAVNMESADGTAAANTAPTPSLRAQANPTPAAISTTPQTAYAHSATATQNGVTFTVSWNDAPARQRDDLPRNPDQRLVPGQARAWTYPPIGTAAAMKASATDARGMVRLLQPGHRGPRLYLRLHGIGHVPHPLLLYGQRQKRPPKRQGDLLPAHHGGGDRNDAARPSVTQIVNDAVAQCRQQTNGSEYDMALWLHDWTLDQLEYDHNLNWCSAESGLTRHQGTCESYQRIYAKLLDAAGIANGRITGNGHTWNAVKIDGKWCQMDLTWDDTSDNWYGDLDHAICTLA